MKNKSNMVYDHLCADCYRKLNTLYRLHDVPLERQRGGRGKCGLCDFRGELTEIEYDRVKDKRSPEERARLRAELNAPPKTREAAGRTGTGTEGLRLHATDLPRPRRAGQALTGGRG